MLKRHDALIERKIRELKIKTAPEEMLEIEDDLVDKIYRQTA
jgi:hypothetical protein